MLKPSGDPASSYISSDTYRLVLEILVTCYDTSELRILCKMIWVPPENIIIHGETIDDAADKLIGYCLRRGIVWELINNIKKDRPGHALVKQLGNLHPDETFPKEEVSGRLEGSASKEQIIFVPSGAISTTPAAIEESAPKEQGILGSSVIANPAQSAIEESALTEESILADLENSLFDEEIVFVSCTPDLVPDTEKHIDWRQNPRARWSYRYVIDSMSTNAVEYYANLRREISECTVFIGLIGRGLGDDIGSLQRSRFEIEYDCAFFNRLPTYLFMLESETGSGSTTIIRRALKKLSPGLFETDKRQRERIDRMMKLQEHNQHPEHTLYFEDRVDLLIEFQNRLASF